MLEIKLPLYVPKLIDTEPVTPKEPVICAEPVKGNPAPLPPPPSIFIEAVLFDTVNDCTPLPLIEI